MHSIPKQVRSLEVGDHFVMDPDQYFFATRYKVISKDANQLIAQIVYRYPPEEGEVRPGPDDGWGKIVINFDKYDKSDDDDDYGKTVFVEDVLWCAFRDRRLPKEEKNVQNS